MLRYIGRRMFIAVPLLIAVSIISFVVIQLPPGSFIDTYIQNLEAQGLLIGEGQIYELKVRYGLDQPIHIQYFLWMRNFITMGDLGRSFHFQRPVMDIIRERLPTTVGISFLALALQWIIAVPVGIYAATRQYSIGDYIVTFLGFIGLALPNFLLAILLMYLVFVHTGWAVTGVFSPEFVRAPWSVARFIDLLKNIWLPVLVVGTSGMAALIRILRGTLLDELRKQYVVTARAKGLNERRLIWKYPVRIAINPLISTIGWMLPAVVGGEIIVSQVLGLPTLGPALLGAVHQQDMFLAGAIVMMLSSLTVIGTLLSDILLAWADPRIRLDKPVKG